LARQVAQEGAPEEITHQVIGLRWESPILADAPIWALPVAWYAWTQMPKNESPLQLPAATQQLQAWVSQAAEIDPPEPYTGSDTGLQFGVDQLLKGDKLREESNSFTKLCIQLRAALADDNAADQPCGLCEALLEIDFSTQYATDGCAGHTSVQKPMSPSKKGVAKPKK
jgi:hypothetical protein